MNDNVYRVIVRSADEFELDADEEETARKLDRYEGGGQWVRYHGTPKPYYQVRFIGQDGREIVRVEAKQFDDQLPGSQVDKLGFETVPIDPESDDFLKINEPYFNKTKELSSQEVWLGEVNLNKEHGQIEYDLVAGPDGTETP